MPEAVKEAEVVTPQANDEKAEKPADGKPGEACSGTLPAGESVNLASMEVEGEKAPPSDEQEPEEGSTPEEEKPTREQVDELLQNGRESVAKHDYYAAADSFGKACEYASIIHGDMADECAENYFLYGSAMLECGKAENTVLGEKVKDGEEEEDDSEEEEAEPNGKQNGQNGCKENGKPEEDQPESSDKADQPESSDKAEETIGEEKEEDEDSSLKVAWEMFELAKVIFERSGNEKRLSDTYMKLGEVGIESGHPTAMEDMLKSLEIRVKLYPGERIVSETHFNIGLAYSMFQLFDDAIRHFELSKSILTSRIDSLSSKEGAEDKDEVSEIKDLLPDLDEKIQDMKESKKVHEEEVAKNGGGSKEPQVPVEDKPSTAAESAKPASNISHLVKRKRKLDEVAADLAPEGERKSPKILRKDEGSEAQSTLKDAEMKEPDNPKIAEEPKDELEKEKDKSDTVQEETKDKETTEKDETNDKSESKDKPEDPPKTEDKEAAKMDTD